MRPGWWVVAGWELRETWVRGRGPVLLFGLAVLLSVTTYLVASNQALNFLEQRESVSLTLQIAVAIGGLLALLGAADTITGERERGTLEVLLVTPVDRRGLLVGKGLAAFSLWLGAWLVSVGYLVVLARGTGVLVPGLLGGLLVGSVLALFLVALGLLTTSLTRSNRVSLATSLFLLLALYAPTQMPSAAQRGWFGELLLKADPFTAALHVLNRLVVEGRGLGSQGGWLVWPVAAAALTAAAALMAARGIEPGGAS
jgi:ABC-2 type transport system permease protein